MGRSDLDGWYQREQVEGSGMQQANVLGSFIFCIPDEGNARKKEDGTYQARKNDALYISFTVSAIHKNDACIDKSGNTQQG